MEEKLITIGKITRHQGNKGEVRINPLTDWPERFNQLEKVYLIKNRIEKEVTIEKIRFHKGSVIIKFESFNNIEKAIEHKSFAVKISEDKVVELPENNYFFHEIIGLDVYTIEDSYLGVIDEILETKANDVYIIRDENSELLIPAIEDVIIEIDLSKDKMKVKLPPGLR